MIAIKEGFKRADEHLHGLIIVETGEEDSIKAILWACGDIGGRGGFSTSSVR